MRAVIVLTLAAICVALPTTAQASSTDSAEAAPPTPKVDPRLAKILADGDGKAPKTAYKVAGVGDEYQILRILNLRPGTQSLVEADGKPFDLFDATDAKTGEQRKVWFDISSFFGRPF